MAVTLRWLVGRRHLGLTVVAGADRLDREIGYVITTELADPTPWLGGGEMVLVTGLGLPQSDDDLDAYVARLVDRDVVGIGFGVGVSTDTIPRGLVRAARNRGLPLIAVPLPTPFLAVAKAVSQRAETLRDRAQEATARAQPRLTRAAAVGGRSALLTELAKACDGTAILLDPHGRTVDSRPALPGPDVLGAVGELARRVSFGLAAGTTSTGPAVVHTIRVGERTHGYLALVSPHEPRPTDHVLIGHANSLLALDFEKPRRVDESATRVNGTALGLALGDAADVDGIHRVLAPAADHSGRIRVLVILTEPEGAPALAGHVEQALRSASRPPFVTVRPDGSVVVLLRADDDPTTTAVLLGGLPVGVRRRLRVGLSTPAVPADVAAAAAVARTAAEAARPGAAPTDAAKLAGHSLLSMPATADALTQLGTVYVTPLVAHDAAHGTDLVASLRAYLEGHGQWETAAAMIGVHRHTLRARIDRIRELLDVDLDSARVRAELLLAVLAHRGGTSGATSRRASGPSPTTPL
ncbi:PucR family transcriptional regulator [Gordonia sp. X0973]|uniref:PucR family transcriptional regulator n=1 Tax=Gordonia sp. X0973 TaxID=2742602 RepID=UPI0013EA221E|nr:PucR family transcriptional regulator [Gordonia sp. X0973]QKT07329.1 PucR family transcriptional regulator [Gordonia sp. X0973]